MTAAAHGRAGLPWAWILGLALVIAGMVPAVAMATHRNDMPVVLEQTNTNGHAWALAIRSDDEVTSYRGNTLAVSVSVYEPFEASVASMGIFELEQNEEGSLHVVGGGVGTAIKGQDGLHVESIGDLPDTTGAADLQTPEALAGNGKIAEMGEIRSMDAGEWRYFVAWSAGSETSVLTVRGQGFEVRGLLDGEGHALGNPELIGDTGTYIRQGVDLPSEISGRQGYVGAGISIIQDAEVSIETSAPLLGLFIADDNRDACAVITCASAGNSIDSVAPGALDRDPVDISLVTPSAGHVTDPQDRYWLMPEDDRPYDGTPLGTYQFRVDHLTDASGPSFRDPVTGTGMDFSGAQIALSLAEIDYRALPTPSNEG